MVCGGAVEVRQSNRLVHVTISILRVPCIVPMCLLLTLCYVAAVLLLLCVCQVLLSICCMIFKSLQSRSSGMWIEVSVVAAADF